MRHIFLFSFVICLIVALQAFLLAVSPEGKL